MEEVRDGRSVGVGFEKGRVAVLGRGAFLDVLDHLLQVLPDQGEEGLQLGGSGVGLAGAAEEDLVFAAGRCVVDSVVLEQEAGGCVVRCEESLGCVCDVCDDYALRKGCMADG